MITSHDSDGRHFVLGIFYFNREDKRLFVPRRIGFGSTFNFGRPVTWVIIAVVVGIVAARTYLQR